MNEPNLIVNVSGESESRILISAMIANFLKGLGVSEVSHLNFDETSLADIKSAFNESDENNFSSVVAVVADWPVEFVDETYDPQSKEETNDEQQNSDS